MKAVALFMLSLASCGIGQTDWRSMSSTERQSALTAISKTCNYPVDRMRILQGNQLLFRPWPEDPYETVDCALRELKRYSGIDMGFVGNEAYSDKAK